jgi:hypothetical protein
MRWMRSVVAAALFAMLVGLAAPAGAQADAGGNSANAKLCQKGGWEGLRGEDGERFTNTGDCVSYAARGGTLAALNPRIEITFTPTFDPRFCFVDVHPRDLDPLTEYTVENWVRAPVLNITEHIGNTVITTDAAGNADYTPYSFFKGSPASGPREALAQSGALTSGWVTIAC